MKYTIIEMSNLVRLLILANCDVSALFVPTAISLP